MIRRHRMLAHGGREEATVHVGAPSGGLGTLLGVLLGIPVAGAAVGGVVGHAIGRSIVGGVLIGAVAGAGLDWLIVGPLHTAGVT